MAQLVKKLHFRDVLKISGSLLGNFLARVLRILVLHGESGREQESREGSHKWQSAQVVNQGNEIEMAHDDFRPKMRLAYFLCECAAGAGEI